MTTRNHANHVFDNDNVLIISFEFVNVDSFWRGTSGTLLALLGLWRVGARGTRDDFSCPQPIYGGLNEGFFAFSYYTPSEP